MSPFASGIREDIRRRLMANGFDKVYVVLGQFLILRRTRAYSSTGSRTLLEPSYIPKTCTKKQTISSVFAFLFLYNLDITLLSI